MRHWLLVLMILLTPLRGFAADVMAVAMAARQGAPAHHGPVASVAVPADAGFALADCAEHHAPATPAAPAGQSAQADAGDDSCPTCASCMVCSSATLALQFRLPPVAGIQHALPALVSASFSSAAPRPGFKPPIS